MNKVLLMILDGWGIGKHDKTDAIFNTPTPFMDSLSEKYPHAQLLTCGENVGLPDGQMGNSEVGHLNIGAGRVVNQDLVRINKACRDNSIMQNPEIVKAFTYARDNKKQVHFMGLVSDGGVHSSLEHLKKLCDVSKEFGIAKTFVHCFMDGRDTDPKSGLGFIRELKAHMDKSTGRIASVIGRYYAMDRDNRWDRVELAYNAIVHGQGESAASACEAVQQSYDKDAADEFVLPTVIDAEGTIKNGDAVIFCNFRPDRGRELTKALVLPEFDGFNREPLSLYMATMTKYEDGLPVHIVYEKDILSETLGEVLSVGGYRQLRIAETEKYAHVTYFFNGGKEDPFEGEDRILVKSPQVATYDLQPEMSAYEVTDKVVEAMQDETYDMIILNFANPDMVGHTGSFEAAVKAIQAVDTCLGRIVEAIRSKNGHLLITADHGNAELMVNHKTGKVHTAHTTNLVPLILMSDTLKTATLEAGKLCDIAPTLLDLAGIEQPESMTGHSLVQKA